MSSRCRILLISLIVSFIGIAAVKGESGCLSKCNAQSNKTEESNINLSTVRPFGRKYELENRCAVPKGDDVIHFSCTAKGRFPDKNEPFCTKYWLCQKLRNGTFVKWSYVCPEGSWFDPKKQLCSIQYVCDCQLSTTTLKPTTVTIITTSRDPSTTSSFTTLEPMTTTTVITTPEEPSTSLSTSIDPSTSSSSTTLEPMTTTTVITTPEEPSTSFSTSKDPSTSSSSTTLKPTTTTTVITTPEEPSTSLSTTTSDSCKLPDEDEMIDFQCTQIGRFSNKNDPFCTKYWLCQMLRNGTFIKWPYTCPEGSWFDPMEQLCNAQYVCDCQLPTTTLKPTTSSTIITTSKDPSSASTTSTLKPTTTTTDITTSEKPSTSFSTSNPSSSTTTSMEPTTSDYCKIPDENDIVEFQCTEPGRFSNQNDPFCTEYWLCQKLRNGTLIKWPYTCPKGSWFDPLKQICNAEYVCDCQFSTTSTEEPSTSLSTTTPVVTTTSDSCKIPDENEMVDFQCTQPGRFSNQNDPFCIEYWLCQKLRNGTLIKWPYTCPKGSWFDPLKQICNADYVCDCQLSTITTEETSISPSTTTSIETTTSASCEIPDKDEMIDFQCTEPGRFSNQNDPFCIQYWLCQKLRNGTFIKWPYTCPKGSWFDPLKQICNTEYVCDCQLSTITTEETSISPSTTTSIEPTTSASCKIPDEDDMIDFQCTQPGRFSNQNDPFCMEFWLCQKLENGTFIKFLYTCPKGYWFDPLKQICTAEYICDCQLSTTTTEEPSTSLSTTTSDETTTSDSCIIPDKDEMIDFQCTEPGRFSNQNDPFCIEYWLCQKLRNGTLIKWPYTCPKGSWFDPLKQICNADYVCDCQLSTITTEETSISPSTTTSIEPTTSASCKIPDEDDMIDFQCTQPGRFSNQNDPFCMEFWLCQKLENGTFIKFLYTCPKGYWFDPLKQICTAEYICDCQLSTTTTEEPSTSLSTTTSDETTTSDSCIIPDKDEMIDFQCTEPGRFSNQNDPFCIEYWLCQKLRNGTLIKWPYTCPKGSWFDPLKQMCNVEYVCDCQSPATSSEDPSTSTTLKPTTITTTTKEPSTFPPTTTSVETTTSNSCKIPDEDEMIDFQCTEPGRFSNQNDPFCTEYWLCQKLRNGTLIKWPYTCPKGSWFDPLKKLCNTGYVCDCQSPTTASEEPSTSTTLNPTTVTTTTKESSTFSPTTTSVETTTSDACKIPDEDEMIDFQCTEPGRFSNQNDPFCTEYWLCQKLRNGTLIKWPYTCPKGSWFDPLKKLCNTGYVCNCQLSTTTLKPTTVTTTTEEPSTFPSTTASILTTTSDSCKIPNDDEMTDFQCTEPGRFSNQNDPFCTEYWLCQKLRNSTLIKWPYTCPKGSWFDPLKKLCNAEYVCDCQLSTTTLKPTSITTTTKEPSTFPPTTTSIVTTTSDSCKIPNKDEIVDFQCTQPGRFLNQNDPFCTEYWLCQKLRNGTLIKWPYTCPEGSWFDPSKNLCNVQNNCNCQLSIPNL